MNSTGPKDAAAGPLDLLAAQLRDLGLTVAVLAPDRTSFPALLVSTGSAEAMIMAGAAYYWRRVANGDMRHIGPLDEPKKAAHAVHEYLTVDPERRRSHRFRFRTGAPVGPMREMAALAGAAAVVAPGVGR